MSRVRTVAIIGGGFAGSLTAIHLLRAGAPGLRVVLITRDAVVGPGVAYAAGSPILRLNVPAARISAFDDDPEHFLRWARRRLDRAIDGDAFLPRSLYGEYLAGLFDTAAAQGQLRVVRASAVDVEDGAPAVITLDDGRRIAADRVVLARGHSLPRHPPVAYGASFYASRRYLRSPWGRHGLTTIAPDAEVLLIGSGLTMYDVALLLRERGHRGTIHALSRRGQLPRVHGERPTAPVDGLPAIDWLRVEPTLRALLRTLRAATAESDGADWRRVVDSLRPVTAALWQRLPAREQQRFVQRLRPYWEVLRHRAAPEVDGRIAHMLAHATLCVRRGQVRGWIEALGGVTVDLGDTQLRVGNVVNCTGPDTDILRSEDPLVIALRARGLIARDRLGLGIETDANGALFDAAGRASARLFTLGTWRKPALWESVAVPELRSQASDLAAHLLHGLRLDVEGAIRRVPAAPLSDRASLASP